MRKYFSKILLYNEFFYPSFGLSMDSDYGIKNIRFFDKEKLKGIDFKIEQYSLYPVFAEGFNYLIDTSL